MSCCNGRLIPVLVILPFLGMASDRHWLGTTNDKASEKANWAEGEAPVDGDAVILDAASANRDLVWDIDAAPSSWSQADYAGTVTFLTGSAGMADYPTHGRADEQGVKYLHVSGGVTLQSGTWTHLANPRVAPTDGTGVYRLYVKCEGDCLIGADAVISAFGKGYRPGMGPGSTTVQSGSSYGGRGGPTKVGVPKPCYGSFREPFLLGSGGSSETYGSNAGGAIRLEAGGLLTVAGRIDSDASSYNADTTQACAYYAGSGGSIWLKAAAIEGAGTLTALGGKVTADGTAGAGRIAVHVTGDGDLSGFTPTILLHGHSVKGRVSSTGGTYYLETRADAGRGELRVYGVDASTSLDYDQNSEFGDGSGESVAVRRVVLLDNAQFAVGSNQVFSADEIVSEEGRGSSNCFVLRGGALKIPGDFKWTSAVLAVRATGSQVQFTGAGADLTADGGVFCFDAPWVLDGNLVLQNGALLTHSANSTTTRRAKAIDLALAGNVLIDATSAIDVTGKGYETSHARQDALGLGLGTANSTNAVRSASHGGKGINPGTAVCYGSIREPVALGSGGNYVDMYGGGALKVIAAGTIRNDGVIRADGAAGAHYPGAGGSVWLSAASLVGGGVVAADGGSASASTAASGGGGRIAVHLTRENASFDDFTGAIHAYGGLQGATGTRRPGSAGTVYLQTAQQGAARGTLVIDNAGMEPVNDTEIDALVTETEVGDVIVCGQGKLRVKAGQTLKVGGRFLTEDGVFVAEPDSTVEVVDATRQTVFDASLRFARLVCTTPGKTIVFKAGTTVSVADGGLLQLEGSEESAVRLVSSTAGEKWNLTLGAGVSQSMDHLSVRDSDATGSATALNSAGENVSGWIFKTVVAGETITWTGAAGDNWSDVGNWDLGRAPVPTDEVEIPAAPNQPKLAADATVARLAVGTGANLALNGFNLTVSGCILSSGAITASDAEVVTVSGDVDFSGGGLGVARATLKLTGVNQQVDLGGRSHWSVDCSAATSPLFAAPFRTRYLICETATAKTLSFAAASAVTVDELMLSGATDDAAVLTLRSATEGTPFLLNVRHRTAARGVSFVDCDASDSLAPVLVKAPSAAVRSPGIVTDAQYVCWKAGASGSFSDASKWVGGTVPGADDFVDLSAGGAITVNAPAAVRELVVGGGAAAVALTLTQPLTVGGSAIVQNLATVSVDTPLTVGNALIVGDGATLTHCTGGRLDVQVSGDCVLDRGGAFDAVGRGYGANKGPGAAAVPSSGGTHGGIGSGGTSKLPTGSQGVPYGSVRRPVENGSGGCWSTATGTSFGGGSICLRVGGALALNGQVSSDAETSEHYSGAGGSVWLTAARLTGSGSVTARGGLVTIGTNNGAGGGGRIALYVTDAAGDFSSFTGTVTARGGGKATSDGTATTVYAGPGTVYRQKGSESDGEGTLVIDNGPSVLDDLAAARLGDQVTDCDVGSIVIAADATLQLGGNKTVSFARDWRNAGRLSAEAGSTVLAVGERPGVIVGENPFYNFTCQAPGKVLSFGTEGSLFEIVAGGLLTLEGDSAQALTLTSTEPGTRWRVNADAAARQQMKCLDVSDSEAVGATMVAVESSGRSQNNVNWSFINVIAPGAVNTWTGENGTSWTDAGNWNLKRPPVETDNVVIPVTVYAPQLPSDVAVWSVTVAPDATLNLANFNLTVSNLVVRGALACSGTETITILKDATFSSAGRFAAARSTLKFGGDGDQSFSSGGAHFNDVIVHKGAGALTFADSLSAVRLKVAAAAPQTVVFRAGGTFAADQVLFHGRVDGAAALTLRSSAEGSAWNVAARNVAFADGVTVSDSTATRCSFACSLPSSGERCAGWVFGVADHEWTGAEDARFANPNNWAGGVVPGTGDCVWLRCAPLVEIDEPLALGAFFLGGDDASVTCRVAAAVSVASLVVNDGAVLVADRAVTSGSGVVVGRGGLITHTANRTEEGNLVDLTAAGDVVIEEGGAIDVKGKGYGKGYGPGLKSQGPSYAGRGSQAGDGTCYGSILNPCLSGSGGASHVWFGAPGGGIVRLVAGGAVQLDGSLTADGADDLVPQVPGSAESCYYGGTGGSVDLRCADVTGFGRLSADGGWDCHSRDGSGGRIAIRLTSASTPSFTGRLSCYGGRSYDTFLRPPMASSGTIYVQGAGQLEGEGTVLLDNAGRTDGNFLGFGVAYPTTNIVYNGATLVGDDKKALAQATFIVRNGAALELTEDCAIGELELEGENSRVLLHGHTLTIRSHKHKSASAPGYKGYTGSVVADGGRIEFVRRSVIIIVR